MASLNHTNAIIFDLWDNLGGYSGTVSLIAAYFFDHSGVHVRSTGKSDAAFFNPFAGCSQMARHHPHLWRNVTRLD